MWKDSGTHVKLLDWFFFFFLEYWSCCFVFTHIWPWSFSFLRGVCDISSRCWELCEACGLCLRSAKRSRSSIAQWRTAWRRAQTAIRAASTVTSARRTWAEETTKPLTCRSWNLLPLCFSVCQETNRWLVASRLDENNSFLVVTSAQS